MVEQTLAGGARGRQEDGKRGVSRRASDLCDRMSSRVRLIVDLDALRVAPQPFERVELARLGREDVNDEVEIVEQHPIRRRIAFHVRRLALGLARAQRFLDRVDDRVHVARVLATEQIKKKSVNAGPWRRLSTMTFVAFFKSAARIAS